MKLGTWNEVCRVSSKPYISLCVQPCLDLIIFLYDPSLQSVPVESSHGLLKVGRIEYTRIGLNSIGVGWVKPCCLQAISWLSRMAPYMLKERKAYVSCKWVSSLPVGNRTAAASCMYDLHVKKAWSGDDTTLESSPGSFYLLQKQNMLCQAARTLALYTCLGVLQGKGLSTEFEFWDFMCWHKWA